MSYSLDIMKENIAAVDTELSAEEREMSADYRLKVWFVYYQPRLPYQIDSLT